jgi:hypothetical protein
VSFLVLVDGSPVWNECSLGNAMDLGVQYAGEGCHVEIVTRNAAELRMWRYDAERRIWAQTTLRRTHKPASCVEDLGLAA